MIRRPAKELDVLRPSSIGPTVLTRRTSTSSNVPEAISDLAVKLRWTEVEIASSLEQTMRLNPTEDAWLFGYGSLIWNPLQAFAERQVATLEGWHRSFCFRSIMGRGNVEKPGRMLAVEPGGQVTGVAYRLELRTLDADLQVVWQREMIFGSYRPIWQEITLLDGRKVWSIVFVSEPEHVLYERDSSPHAVARVAERATGILGSNADYILRLSNALSQHGIEDTYVQEIVAQMALRRV
jgi:cation transport protein ChaC